MKDLSAVKVQHTLRDPAQSRLGKYRELIVGKPGWWPLLRFELICGLVGGMPGALGIWLRGKLYPRLLGSVGRGVVFGRHVTFRHPHKIHLGDGAVIDDLCMLDAKGFANQGITLGEGVFIGRGSVLVCKDGDIHLEAGVNLSYFCEIFSSNRVTVGAKSMVAAYCYLMSGGAYDCESPIPFADQGEFASVGPLEIGPGCWLGAKAVVLDGACIGAGTVVGAGAVVNRPLPAHSVAVGVPARVVRSLGAPRPAESREGVGEACGSA